MKSIGEIQLAPGAAEPVDDSHQEISRLEDRIEELAAAIENCRKIMMASRIAIAVGGLVVVAMTFGAIGFDPLGFIAAVTGFIGGIVLFGSNKSTAEQAAAELQAAEARRGELIGNMNLRLVGEGRS
jgi:hypothetical protein